MICLGPNEEMLRLGTVNIDYDFLKNNISAA